MVVRIEGVPASPDEPGTYPIKFVRMNGDVAIYEFVANPKPNDLLQCLVL